MTILQLPRASLSTPPLPRFMSSKINLLPKSRACSGLGCKLLGKSTSAPKRCIRWTRIDIVRSYFKSALPSTSMTNPTSYGRSWIQICRAHHLPTLAVPACRTLTPSQVQFFRCLDSRSPKSLLTGYASRLTPTSRVHEWQLL